MSFTTLLLLFTMDCLSLYEGKFTDKHIIRRIYFQSIVQYEKNT